MTRNKKKDVAREPVTTATVNLDYSNGEYKFFCKTTAAIFRVVLSFFAALAGLTVDNVKPAAWRALVSCIWVVNHMSLKLEGISSISSSVHDNCFCAAWRKVADCICAKCYAHSQQAVHTGLKEHNIINGLILRNVLIPVKFFKALPILFPYIRIESFGDVANVIQARNYIRIIKAFPRKRCAIWSKNLAIWDKAIQLEGKPANTTFVASSPYINKPIAENILKKYSFIDHVFTVYTKKFARENGIAINCGGRKCLECIRKRTGCYYRNNAFYINELLK